MKKYGDTIGEGKACVVVRAQGLDRLDHEFWKWLRDEGFTMWHNHRQQQRFFHRFPG